MTMSTETKRLQDHVITSITLLAPALAGIGRHSHSTSQHVRTDDSIRLIALMLGRLRMSIQDAIKIYLRFGDKVFGHPRLLRQAKYSSERLEKVLKKVLNDHCVENIRGGEAEFMVQQDHREELERRCMTTVVAQKKAKGLEKTWLFRSYDHIHSSDQGLGDVISPGYAHDLNHEAKIWEVARATTAAPTYFKEMKIGGDRFMDGGVGANNPAHLAWNSARQITRTPDHRIAIFISVGTGMRQGRSPFGHTPLLGSVPALLGFMRHKLSDTEQIHKQMRDLVDNQMTDGRPDSKTFYSRLNVDLHLHDMQLDEWKKRRRRAKPPREGVNVVRSRSASPTTPITPRFFIGEPSGSMDTILQEVKTVRTIEDATAKYLQRSMDSHGYPAVTTQIQECARKLVDQARARRRANMSRWQYFIGERNTPRTSTVPNTYNSDPATLALRTNANAGTSESSPIYVDAPSRTGS